MTEEAKRIWDVVLTVLAIAGAVIGFVRAMREWQVSQRWKRSEYLDSLIDKFESQLLLRLGCLVVDWTFREVVYSEKTVKVTNKDVLLALRRHDHDGVHEFDGNQALVRDCLDAMLGFFSRIETALSTGLIDEVPTRRHFEYWLRKLVRMDSHPVSPDDPDAEAIVAELKGRSPSEMVAGYVTAYGDTDSFRRLCRRLKVPFPELDRVASGDS